MSGRGRSQKSLDLVDAAVTILQEIQPCSVRAVCYRLFTLGVITSMAKSETNRVGSLLTRAREEGVIPWAWITDETREPARVEGQRNPEVDRNSGTGVRPVHKSGPRVASGGPERGRDDEEQSTPV